MTILQLAGLVVFGFMSLNGLLRFILAVRFTHEPFSRLHTLLLLIGVIGLLVTFFGIQWRI